MANDSWNRWDQITRKLEELKRSSEQAEAGYRRIPAPRKARERLFERLRREALHIVGVLSGRK